MYRGACRAVQPGAEADSLNVAEPGREPALFVPVYHQCRSR